MLLGRESKAAHRRKSTWLAFGVGFAICALFAWEVATTVKFVVDDSYITFEFSKNLARGLGPTYGQGMRVEGYSNFLWMVLVALPLLVVPSGDPLVLARLLTIPFAALLFLGAYGLARARAGRLLSVLAVVLVAIDVNIVLAFQSGLETLPYVALVTAGLAAYVRGDRSVRLRNAVVPLFTAAALTRIDGFVPLGGIVLFDTLRSLVERRFSFARLARFAAPGLAVWAVWFAWRWSYYGLPLPTTYYAKSLIPRLMPERGPDYVASELLGSGLYCALPAALFLLWKRRRACLPVALFAIGQILYAAKVGGDWMPSGRFVLPAFPPLIVLVVWAGQAAFDLLKPRSFVLSGLVAAATLALLVWVGTRAEPHQTDAPYVASKLALSEDQVRHVAGLKRGAEFLAAAVPRGSHLVTDYGGVLAYYTEATPIEMWGLCNRLIALRGDTEQVNPIYGKTCPACYPELGPDFFHVGEPLVRGRAAFKRHRDVVMAVWQTDTIGRYLDIENGFETGRVSNERSGEAAWFLERKGIGWRARPRRSAGLIIEYPFVPGGLVSG